MPRGFRVGLPGRRLPAGDGTVRRAPPGAENWFARALGGGAGPAGQSQGRAWRQGREISRTGSGTAAGARPLKSAACASVPPLKKKTERDYRVKT